MDKRIASAFIAAALAVAGACAQAPAANTNVPVRIGVQLAQEKGVFYNDEALSATIHLNNTSQQKIDGVLVTEIKTDAGAPVTVLKTPLSLPKAGLTKQAFSHKVSQPGFYRVTAHLEWDNTSGPTTAFNLGYSSGPAIPQRDDQPVIRYVASTRGQGVMKPGNIYGDWMAYRLDSRDDYYFRGAYLDTVRAIDFVCTRPEVDQSRIAVEGGSQGGTLSYICAALDKRVAFCMPTIPGFCDIPTFIELTPWPGGVYRHYLATNDKGVTQEAMYAMLTYYDVKNFADWITCPVYMGVGLQDTICPPRTNFAPYNLLKAEKRFLIYPETGHGVRGSDYHPKAYKWMIEKLGI
jgi:pimeloyl-ACP methyl ester carboxylesterase